MLHFQQIIQMVDLLNVFVSSTGCGLTKRAHKNLQLESKLSGTKSCQCERLVLLTTLSTHIARTSWKTNCSTNKFQRTLKTVLFILFVGGKYTFSYKNLKRKELKQLTIN